MKVDYIVRATWQGVDIETLVNAESAKQARELVKAEYSGAKIKSARKDTHKTLWQYYK